jgi:diadenosine tetraphosphate (Ap4A) HIT family hydrolase
MTPKERLARLEQGLDPCLIVKMDSGFAVMSETQYLPGYSLLLASPFVGQLDDLKHDGQMRFLSDLAKLGSAVKRVTGCKRVNFAIYGNKDPFLHAHVWPRYEWEHEVHAPLPPLSLPSEHREQPEFAFSMEKHGELQGKIRSALQSPGIL